MMTKEELKKAFEAEFKVHKNYRDFERGLSDMRVRLINGEFKTFAFIEGRKGRERLTLTLDELLKKVNEESWEIQPLEEDQQMELEILSKLEGKYYDERIEEFEYETKSGKKLKKFFVKYEKGTLEKLSLNFLFSWMGSLVGCWYSKEKGGFILSDKEIAKEVIDYYDQEKFPHYDYREYKEMKQEVLKKIEQ